MTPIQSVAVRTGNRSESTVLSDLINRAFFDLAANAYLVPGESDRMRVMGRYFALQVEHALASPHAVADVAIDTSARPVGVAIWSAHTDPGPEDYDARLAEAVPVGLLDRFRTFETLMHAPLPQTAHSYLGFLAVEPNLQSRGIGATLLDAGHRRLEPFGVPALLIASNARSRDLYLRHRYAPFGANVELPNGAHMYPMMRT